MQDQTHSVQFIRTFTGARDAPRVDPVRAETCVCRRGLSRGALVFGEDPDGLVLCRMCRRPLFYCDIGGQG